jgi:hypothetical protein
VNTTFVTPIDGEDIYGLATRLDATETSAHILEGIVIKNA